MPGPLPNPQRARRNAPAIPTTDLPAGGRKGPIPKPPKWVELGSKGLAWWRWAWRTPQAAAWSSGHEAFVANRASLEDDLAVLEVGEFGIDIRVLDAMDVTDMGVTIDFLVRRLHSLAVGRLAVLKECREMDDRLGLTPKSLAALRWRIVADEPEAKVEPAPAATSPADRRQRLKVV